MVHSAVDLVQFVQRRELLAYEQRLARAAYAYGVDLRRSRWLDRSTLGDPLMRTVDRRWPRLVEQLSADTLQPPGTSIPIAMLEQVGGLVRLLRAPLPSVRLLRPGVASRDGWSHVTALGTTKGGVQWLVLDSESLASIPGRERAFLLGAGLAHLQCDHGPMFTAHLMAHRGGRGLGLVRRVLTPWTRVAAFSADRAGLLSAGALEPALRGLGIGSERASPWMPRGPDMKLRIQGLREFDRSVVVTRLRVLSERDDDGAHPPSVGPDPDERGQPDPSGPPKPDLDLEAALRSAWSLARCDQRLTRRLRLL